jgi:EmrB/QacA subfamily drug resistance transporter
MATQSRNAGVSMQESGLRTPSKHTHPNLILAICCMSLLLIAMDVTIVNVALPAIQHDLQATIPQLQWIIDAYTLVLASLLMLSGSMSDRFGRRRVFQIGLILFSLGSLLCSVAPNIEGLILFRGVQGIGASMLNPVALSIIANAFTEPRDRARAVGIWGAVTGVSLALGPLIGGALTQTIGWRSIFWVNVPVSIAAIILTALFVPESKAPRARRSDPLGQLFIFGFLCTLTYAVIESPFKGWNSPLILGLLITALVLFITFLLHEAHRREPLLDLRFFRSVPFSTAALLAIIAYACFAGFLFLNALYLQQIRNLSAFTTGLCTLPLAIVMMLTSPLSGRLVGSRGPQPSLLLSGLGFVSGTLILTQLSSTTPIVLLLVAYVLFGLGLGMVNPAISNSAVAGMPLSQAGVAASVASTSRQVGAALGVAVAGTVVSLSHAHHSDFARATHPIWGIMVACGFLVILAGYVSNTAWAKFSTERVASLF